VLQANRSLSLSFNEQEPGDQKAANYKKETHTYRPVKEPPKDRLELSRESLCNCAMRTEHK